MRVTIVIPCALLHHCQAYPQLPVMCLNQAPILYLDWMSLTSLASRNQLLCTQFIFLPFWSIQVIFPFFALVLVQYYQDANEADVWMNDKADIAANQDYGRDEDAAVKALKKHRVGELGL